MIFVGHEKLNWRSLGGMMRFCRGRILSDPEARRASKICIDRINGPNPSTSSGQVGPSDRMISCPYRYRLKRQNHFLHSTGPYYTSSNRGFSRLRLILVGLLLCIIAIVIFPRLISSTPAGHQRKAIEIAGKLESAAQMNVSFRGSTTMPAKRVRNCRDGMKLFPRKQKLPRGFSIRSQPLSAGHSATCELINPDGKTTVTFMAVGV